MNRRTREFAIQMMLGTMPESIFRSVMRKGLQQIAIGLVCWLILALPAAWTFARMITKSPLPVHAFGPSVYCIRRNRAERLNREPKNRLKERKHALSGAQRGNPRPTSQRLIMEVGVAST
jgi:hypothetical protein